MTEDEAKTKTCHKTLAPVASADGSAPWHSPAVCIGSACMAWRWEDDAEEVATDRKCEVCKGSGVVVTGSGETAGGEECTVCVGGYQTEPVQLGYCGLAGKP